MKIQIRCNTEQQQIIKQRQIVETTNIFWDNEQIIEAVDAYIDLLFSADNNFFVSIAQKPVIINSVLLTLELLPQNFSCINALPTFLEREKLELNSHNSELASSVLNAIGYKHIEAPNIVGMIALRSIAMIINEAYFALQDEVSSKSDIDTAMKLGTNYPYGPFEWSQKIGLQHIGNLLLQLAKTDERYIPCSLLIDEMNS